MKTDDHVWVQIDPPAGRNQEWFRCRVIAANPIGVCVRCGTLEVYRDRTEVLTQEQYDDMLARQALMV